jgi:hypothetical protein
LAVVAIVAVVDDVVVDDVEGAGGRVGRRAEAFVIPGNFPIKQRVLSNDFSHISRGIAYHNHILETSPLGDFGFLLCSVTDV